MKTVAKKSWAFLLAFVVALTTLFAGTLTAFASDAAPKAPLDNGTFEIDGYESNFSMFGSNHVDASMVIKDGQPYLILDYDGTRYGQIMLGKYDDVIKSGTEEGVEGFPSAKGTMFVLPVSMDDVVNTLNDGTEIYYVLRYVKGYDADHDGTWYKPKKDPSYLKFTEARRVSEATDLPEPAVEPTELKVNNNVKMFNVKEASISGNVLTITMNSGAYDKVYMGHSELAEDAAEDELIDIDAETHQFTLNLKGMNPETLLSFRSKSHYESGEEPLFYNRVFKIDIENKVLDIENYKEAVEELDGLTAEQAIAKTDELASVEMVNSLIRALKVQYRDDNTDKYCEVANAYYNAIAAKGLAEELNDSEYFESTGDATLDNPRNQDGIGEKEILVVSFGTSFSDSRVATIKGIEDALEKAYPDYSVRRAFTAQIIINHIQARDGEKNDNMTQALERAVANGVKELVVQPTHLMHGAEYDEMCKELAKYEGKFEKIIISEPLLNSDGDKINVALNAIGAAAIDAGYTDDLAIDTMDAEGVAIVFMGHGTAHPANVTYNEMQDVVSAIGKNIFVGTVEGEPEETEVYTVLKKVQDAGYKKVILRPLMVVAGDHANNDMAGDDDDSWKSIFSEALGAENVTCQIKGLGQIADIQNIYVNHVNSALHIADKNFKAYLNGEELKVVGYADDQYPVYAWNSETGAMEQVKKVPIYGVEVPFGSDDVTLKFDQKVLAYNYEDDGTWLAGYYEDYKVGSEEAVVPTDANNDGYSDYIQVQTPYYEDASAAYGESSDVLYAIEFKYTYDQSAVKATLPKTSYAYTGKAIKPAPAVSLGNGKLHEGLDYTVSYKNNKAVGKATVVITGIYGLKGYTETLTFNITKAANPMKVTAKTITGKVKKNTTFAAKKAFTVNKAQGKVTYKQVTKNAKIKVASNGKVTVKKGLKKGKTFKIKVKVTAKGNGNYKAATKNVVLKVKVK